MANFTTTRRVTENGVVFFETRGAGYGSGASRRISRARARDRVKGGLGHVGFRAAGKPQF